MNDTIKVLGRVLRRQEEFGLEIEYRAEPEPKEFPVICVAHRKRTKSWHIEVELSETVSFCGHGGSPLAAEAECIADIEEHVASATALLRSAKEETR